MWATITRPFAWLMLKLYDWTGNYGVALILFGLTVNLILTPFMAKSKKSTMQSTRLQPRIQELQTRHAGNQQKLNEEIDADRRAHGKKSLKDFNWTSRKSGHSNGLLVDAKLILCCFGSAKQVYLSE